MERISELLDDVAINPSDTTDSIYRWMIEATNRIQELQARTEGTVLATPETKYRYPESEQFPILLETFHVLVYENSVGEIFIENKRTGVTMRITPSHNDMTVTAAEGRLVPTSVNGLSAFAVTSR